MTTQLNKHCSRCPSLLKTYSLKQLPTCLFIFEYIYMFKIFYIWFLYKHDLKITIFDGSWSQTWCNFPSKIVILLALMIVGMRLGAFSNRQKAVHRKLRLVLQSSLLIKLIISSLSRFGSIEDILNLKSKSRLSNSFIKSRKVELNSLFSFLPILLPYFTVHYRMTRFKIHVD